MTVELKPCPFCGGQVDFEHVLREDNHRYPRDFWHVRVSCCNADTGWMSYGEQEERNVTEEVKSEAEIDVAGVWNSRAPSPALTSTSGDDDETYEIGKRDGYSEAVQQIDQLTGGDGEYRYCTDHDPDRHTPGPAEMIQRIVDRFETLNLLDNATKAGRDQEWGISGTSGDDEAPVAWRYRHKEWSEDFWNYFTKEPRYKEDDEIWQGLYARPQPSSMVDDILDLYRMSVETDVTMEGVHFMGVNRSALKRAWEADRAALARPQSAAVRDGWQSIETAPKDGTVIQAWHSVHQCPMSVLWKDEGFPFNGERLNWYERSYTTAWPERAFSHWTPLPAAPALHSTQEG